MRRPSSELRVEQRVFLQAQGCTHNEDFQQAKKFIFQLYEIYDCAGPSPSAPIKLNILSAIVSIRLGELDDASVAVTAAVEGLSVRNDEYAFNDAAYLIEYCRQLLEFLGWKPCDMPSAGLYDIAWLRRILAVMAFPSTREMFPMPKGH